MFDDGSKLTLCKISILLLCIALKDCVCAGQEDPSLIIVYGRRCCII